MGPLDAAISYLAAGYSIVPITTDGLKIPATRSWRGCMVAPPSEEQVREWYARVPTPGVALVGGAVSGGLECIDFDREAATIYPAWRDMVEKGWPGLLDCVSVVKTPRAGGGYHVWLRCDGKIPGNDKLARLSEAEQATEKTSAEAEGRKANLTLIETRGEGGYALVPGCPPACHETGRLYAHHDGRPLDSLIRLSTDERDFLITCARAFDRSIVKAEPIPKSAPGNDLRPGDDFDRTGWDWGELLGKYGWTLAHGSAGGERRWRRPGKDRGWSATTGHCSSNGSDLFRVFSSNAHPFEDGKAYGKFRTFALLETGGDLSKAAQHLRHLGYGSPTFSGKMVPVFLSDPQGRTEEEASKVVEPFPVPIPASQLRLADPAVSWIWNGYLRRGEVTLMSALWKAGKTTLLAHLLRGLGAGGLFLDRVLIPSRVLYVTEESESRWATRRDQIGLEDHVHFLVRPFAAKPRIERWEEFLAHVNGLITANSYDVVVFDTLANLWPVRDENDASAVQAALMPLHSMIDRVALQLVHHTRKSDGSEATASRGSGALTGFVDTIIEFRRFNASDRADRRRVLSGYGRHDETPQELVIELTEDGYVAQGDRDSVSRQELADVILGILPPRMPGLTPEQVAEEWPEDAQRPRPGSKLLAKTLHSGAENGLWVQSGTGKRGSPYLYWLSGAPTDFSVSPQPLYRDCGLTGNEKEGPEGAPEEGEGGGQ